MVLSPVCRLSASHTPRVSRLPLPLPQLFFTTRNSILKVKSLICSSVKDRCMGDEDDVFSERASRARRAVSEHVKWELRAAASTATSVPSWDAAWTSTAALNAPLTLTCSQSNQLKVVREAKRSRSKSGLCASLSAHAKICLELSSFLLSFHHHIKYFET